MLTDLELSKAYPNLFHMAAEDSWPSIEKHGLLSTERLLDLFQVESNLRRKLASEHRPESVMIEHPRLGRALIRDQKPMSYAGLRRALPSTTAPEQWLKILNSMVFFWPTIERLSRFVNAREYRAQRKTIMILDTRKLLSQDSARIRLSHLNSGCTKPYPHPRDPASTFLPISAFPYHDRVARRLDPIAEISVLEGVQNVGEVATAVFETGGNRCSRILLGSLSEFGVVLRKIGADDLC